MLFTLKVIGEDGSDTSGNPRPYYAEIDRIAVGLKDRYREMVQADAVIKKAFGRDSTGIEVNMMTSRTTAVMTGNRWSTRNNVDIHDTVRDSGNMSEVYCGDG